jgi:hypothetical protein
MYIALADSMRNGATGQVLIVKLGRKGKIRHTIPTLYNPSVAVSPSGAHLFIADSDVATNPATHRLSLYDLNRGRLLATQFYKNRFLYNVIPHCAEIAPLRERTALALQAHILGDDEAEFGVAQIDFGTRKSNVTAMAAQFAYSIIGFGLVGKGPGLYYALDGRTGRALGAQPRARGRLANVWSQPISPLMEPVFEARGVIASIAGDAVYHVSRDGKLRIHRRATNRVSTSIDLEFPTGYETPLQAISVSKKDLFVGVSPPALAARGLTESVMIFELGRDIQRSRSIGLSPPANYFAATVGGSELLALSTQERILRRYNAVSGRVLATYENQGVFPVRFAIAANGKNRPDQN